MNSFKIMELGQPSHFIGEETKAQRLNGLPIQTGKFQIKLKLSLKKKNTFFKKLSNGCYSSTSFHS